VVFGNEYASHRTGAILAASTTPINETERRLRSKIHYPPQLVVKRRRPGLPLRLFRFDPAAGGRRQDDGKNCSSALPLSPSRLAAGRQGL